MKKLLVLPFLLGCFFIAAGQHADELRNKLLQPQSGTVLVAAHRAAHQRYAENSLDAIYEAIRLGVDIVEIDVKVSKDGVPFLMHDRTLNRTTTGMGDPETFAWDELQQLFIVDKGRRTSLKIPPLEAALNLAKGKILVDLDLKTDRVEAVMEIVKKTGTQDIVIFFDSDYNVLKRVHDLDNDIMLMPRAKSITQADSAITLFDPPVVHIDFSFYTKECATLIQGSHARIWINALGELDSELKKGRERRVIKELVRNGANVIQTDEPELLLEALARRGFRP